MGRRLREFSRKKLIWNPAIVNHCSVIDNKQCLVIVPIYKATPSKNERASFLHLLSVLNGHYEIALLHGKSLDISNYKINGVHLSEVICDDIFFTSRACYSDMMEFSEFYKTFSDYQYILIYQLDAWIFENKLEYFINLGYDYIGSIHTYTGSTKLRVGNGGFSLRKVSSFIDICKTEDISIPSAYPEDLAFSDILSDKLKIAPVSEGLKFGFQNMPSKLYAKNGNKLPMGCHAFEKVEFSWWKNFIKIDEVLKYGIYSKDAELFKKAEEWTISKGANLTYPKTISDKLSWLKIYDCSPLKTLCADKIGIHEYCKEKLGKDICVPILKVYDNPEKINFDELPVQFVLKCNHGSGYNIIVKNKNNEDKSADVSKLKMWLSKDYALDYWYEMHYHYIDRKCYAEEYLGDGVNDVPDYKILCCNGEPIMIQVISDRFHKETKHANIYTVDWKWWDIGWHTYKADSSKPDTKPENLEEMLDYARKLSKDFKFVRVDFYTINGRLYLGELTFVPDAGFMHCKNRDTEIEIGNMLDISSMASKKRGVVYTCICGGYDSLQPLSAKNKNFDYVCYTDKDIESDFWTIRKIPDKLSELDNPRKNRYVKTHPHELFPNYELSIYIDGNVDIRGDLTTFIDKECNKDNGVIFAGQHPNRNCIYNEANAVLKSKKDTANNVLPQIKNYEKEGFPKNYGLSQNCILIRYHNDNGCRKIMEEWWQEILNKSYRDQLSLFYVLWKNPDIKYALFEKTFFNGPIFVWEKLHKKEANRRKTIIIDGETKTQKPLTEIFASDTEITSLSTGRVATSARPKYMPMLKIGARHPRTKSMKKVLSIF